MQLYVKVTNWPAFHWEFGTVICEIVVLQVN